MRVIKRAAVVAISAVAVSGWLAGPSWADPTISLQLTPSNIAADGASTSTATITDDDPGVTASDLSVTSNDPGESISSVTPNQDGTYSATITSSTTPGTVTVTATDSADDTSAPATLIQHGPAASVGVQFSPTSTIVANGISTTNVIATVEDSQGDAVPGDTVSFSSNPTGNQFGTVTDNGDGTYTATLTSTTVAGTPTITATDTSASVSGQATLTQIAGPAANVSVTPSPSSIVANGTSTSTITAAITDAYGNSVSGDSVHFTSSDSGDRFTPATATSNASGIATSTLRSSTRAGRPTITATDTGTGASGTAQLAQTAGQPTSLVLTLSPASITANGTSVSTATATVADVNGNPVTVGSANFTSSDPGDRFSATTNNGDGTYTATVTSSTTAGTPTITATDGSAFGHATLTQIAASNTVLAVTSPSTVANQAVGLLAVVSAASGNVAGTVTFENSGVPIAGCANQPVSASSLNVSCSASFGAGSPQLSAVFTPGAGATVAGSTGTASLAVSRDGTSTSLVASSPTVNLGGTATYTASLAALNPGLLAPLGSVEFLDNGQPIGQCAAQPVVRAVATCTIGYSALGSHSISAVYAGDGNFAGSSSAPAALQVQPLGTLPVTMRWGFVSTDSSTRVLALTVSSAPIGVSVKIACRGGGCPFAKRAAIVNKRLRCNPKGKSCAAAGTLDLTSLFQKHQLHRGATITVQIVRAGWVGRVFTFVARPPRATNTTSACLVPGASKPSRCP